jgi:hypothetical protein
MIEGAVGKVPTNMWTACVEVRTQGAIGVYHQHLLTVRAEPRDIQRYIFEDLAFLKLEPRFILWIGKVTQ